MKIKNIKIKTTIGILILKKIIILKINIVKITIRMIDKESLKINHMSTVSINKLFIIKNINKIKAIKEIEVNNKECIKMIKD
jgi:hypothetical protein